MSFDPENEASLENWVLAHASDHVEIRQAILAQGLANLPDYVLYPINFSDLEGFNRKHQTTHDEANSVLNVPGQDLSALQFEDKDEFQRWLHTHFTEHLNMRTALGI